MQKKIWGLAGLVSLCLLTTNVEAVKLAEVNAAVTGKDNLETVTLYGDKLSSGSDYYHNLLLMVTDKEGKLKTAFTPSIRGGYFPFLKTVSRAGTQTEILLAVAQGEADRDVAYRLVDFSNPDKVKETFSGIDNFGITTTTQYLEGRRFRVSCDLSGAAKVFEAAVGESDQLHVFDAAGKVQKAYLRPQVTKIVALTPVQEKLLSTQNILDADGTTLLGQLYITWDWDKEKQVWVPGSVHWDTTDTDEDVKLEKARVNSSAAAGNWQLYNRTYVHQGVEISYPEVAVAGKPDVQNKINAVIQDWLKTDTKNSQQAYRLEFTGPRLLSMLAFRQTGEDQVTEKIFNFNMETGATIPFQDMFNYKDQDFKALLNLLGVPQNSVQGLPRDWYYNGGTFVFILPEADIGRKKEYRGEKVVPVEKNMLPGSGSEIKKTGKKVAVAGESREKLKKQPVPKAVFNADGSFTKGQPQEVGIGAGYLVKFVIDKKLPSSNR